MPQERHGPRRAEFLGLEVPRPRSQEQRVPRAITLGMESCRGLADLFKLAIGSRLEALSLCSIGEKVIGNERRRVLV